MSHEALGRGRIPRFGLSGNGVLYEGHHSAPRCRADQQRSSSMELDSVLFLSGSCTQSYSRLMDGAFGKPRRAGARPNRKAFEMNSDTAKFIGNIPVHYDGDLCLCRLCRRHLTSG